MKELESCFKGLSDANRLRIMNLLLEGELCVCDIQRVLGSPQPNVSRHLNYLKHAGLVVDRRDGLRVFYRLRKDNSLHLDSLHKFLREAFSGDKALGADLRELRSAIRKGACALPSATLSTGKSRQAVARG
jgi:ArsR family transcriptional regulator